MFNATIRCKRVFCAFTLAAVLVGCAAPTAPDPAEPDGGAVDAAAVDAQATDAATGDASVVQPVAPRTVMVHLFEWRWQDIARECELVLGPGGFSAVQVSPPQEHAVFDFAPWWQRYQPVSYRLVSRSGDRQAFADMVQRCAQVGVHVYVDAVLNHMSFRDAGVGSGGSPHTRYSYPGLYEDMHFHDCRQGISDYNDRWQVQNCDLATAPDLATDTDYVRDRLAEYLQDLIDLGVAGVRLDGAKHMAHQDIAAVLSRLTGSLYVYQEVIDFGDSAIPASEYFVTGDVTEFRYSAEIARVFRRGSLAWLHEFGEAWGFVPGDYGVVFVDNHDNQRGHGAPGDAITYKDGRLHELANIFMLAWPYGYPRLMSSYEFSDGTQGPPGAGGVTSAAVDPSGACAIGWVCEHRKLAVRNMVRFRNVTSDAFFTDNWWSNGNDQIAFGRGGLGFIAINREEAGGLTQSLQTGMAPGEYCDVTTGDVTATSCSGRTLHVAADGTAQVSIGPKDALAIHVDSRLP